jgi:hypothetical protein
MSSTEGSQIKKQRNVQCNDDTCGVCLDTNMLEVPPNYRTRLDCGHWFHTLCIDSVFRSTYASHNLCPLCLQETTPELRRKVGRIAFDVLQENYFLKAYPYKRETIPIPPGSFILTKQMFDLIDKQSLVGANLSVYSPESGAVHENVNELHFRKVADDVKITEIYQEQAGVNFMGDGFYYRFSGPVQRSLVPGSQMFDVNRDIYVVTPAPTIFARIIQSLPTYYIGNVACIISGGKRKTRIRNRKGRSRKTRRRRRSRKNRK